MEKMPVSTGNSILLTKKREYMPQKVSYLGKECKKPKSIKIIYTFLTLNRKNLQFNQHRTEVST
jgi:hypothetical protein